ncbi:hypothetical protein EBL_c15670 [Shimwellia blattae DSM 4481 = NBRC 105725]|uniref:Uncharacterized protein n=1 Tax=Shimwellia blattae (strain ATCC 29907 / DSM 4481 / JCM 1650 / NBRC 105725 / CDC 9005-74) TaxID=630626 RepID=I2B807_SHIBC|nr:hypothetical protein EBL_c15670 [Shimwellia blattae DSM 4481 = NBRC 105725]
MLTHDQALKTCISFSGKLILHRRANSHHRISVITYIDLACYPIKKSIFITQLIFRQPFYPYVQPACAGPPAAGKRWPPGGYDGYSFRPQLIIFIYISRAGISDNSGKY